ncbi:endonuclease [Candidatus Methylomirabilis lanthanidiphila]|uniref:Endonuclease n=1 Tax=Candidatus Methylomirabilis lanthanidiphila TaxID=2211376 RepID=A0A564ZLB0_9BACT|nr:endonuclease III domain-containing protein [Candidatus Methylomirabilis lanthanidiphila]VUZ86094.1 endonuclease [Candidatus Methylomirabilis lanthanidiphila]
MPQTATGRRLLSLYRHLFQQFGPQHWWPARSRFEVIVGAILTQNTAWTNVEKAIAALRVARLLNPRGINTVPQERLASLIRSAGYYNMKAERLKHFTHFLLIRYGGSVQRMFRGKRPGLREELLTISGIGEETADSILLYAGDRPIFVVDAYTRRVLERHGLIAANTSYGEIQRLFMTHLPADPALFNEYHALLVAVGKIYCRRTPHCESCPLRCDLPNDSPLLPRPQEVIAFHEGVH